MKLMDALENLGRVRREPAERWWWRRMTAGSKDSAENLKRTWNALVTLPLASFPQSLASAVVGQPVRPERVLFGSLSGRINRYLNKQIVIKKCSHRKPAREKRAHQNRKLKKKNADCDRILVSGHKWIQQPLEKIIHCWAYFRLLTNYLEVLITSPSTTS